MPPGAAPFGLAVTNEHNFEPLHLSHSLSAPMELEAAEDAADAAAREGWRTIRAKRKAEVSANVEARVGKLKEKLHVS